MTEEAQGGGEPQEGAQDENAAAESGDTGAESGNDAAGAENTGDQDGPEPEPEPDPEPEARDHVTVTVTAFSQTKGVELVVNGRPFLFPIGKSVTVPAWALPSLAAVGGARFTVE